SLPLLADDPAEADPDRGPAERADGVEGDEVRPAQSPAHQQRPRAETHDGEEAAEDHRERRRSHEPAEAIVDPTRRTPRQAAVDVDEPDAPAGRRPEPELIGEHRAER